MKLTYEDKVEMYRLWKEDHYSSIRLATLFKCDRTSGKIHVARCQAVIRMPAARISQGIKG